MEITEHSSDLHSYKAMLFAAGLGTRLKPFTDNHPKALAWVNGKTLLERNLNYLYEFGIRDVVINTFHFADQIESAVQTYPHKDLSISLLYETDGPYETGGGLVHASPYFKDLINPFVVMNADILTKLDLGAMMDFHLKVRPMVTLAVSKRESSRQFLFDDHMKLVGWQNNKTGEVRWSSDEVKETKAFSFSGIHIIAPEIFNSMPSSGKFSITETYITTASRMEIVGYDHTGEVTIDVGKPESILEAERIFK